MPGDANILLLVMAVLPPGQGLLGDATRLKAPFPPTSSAPARRRQQPMTMMAPRFASREDMFVMIYADTYAVLYAQGTRTGILRTVRTRGIGQLAPGRALLSVRRTSLGRAARTGVSRQRSRRRRPYRGTSGDDEAAEQGRRRRVVDAAATAREVSGA